MIYVAQLSWSARCAACCAARCMAGHASRRVAARSFSDSRLSAGAATSSVAAGAAGCPEPVVQPDMHPAAQPAGRALFGATADSSPYSEPGVFFFPPSPDETSQSDAGPPGVCFLFVYALRAHCLMLCFADFTALTAARAFFCPESRPRSLRRTAHETRSTKHSRKQRTRSA